MIQEQQEFFDKLKQLCKEYKSSIGSCGCCDGTSVTFIDDSKEFNSQTVGYYNYLSTYPEFGYCDTNEA